MCTSIGDTIRITDVTERLFHFLYQSITVYLTRGQRKENCCLKTLSKSMEIVA